MNRLGPHKAIVAKKHHYPRLGPKCQRTAAETELRRRGSSGLEFPVKMTRHVRFRNGSRV